MPPSRTPQGADVTVPASFIAALPKAELHVHLDGSLRPETLLELADEAGVEMPARDPVALANAMRADDATDLASYLSRFERTLAVLQTADSLVRVTRELVEDHAAENVRVVEIRYSPVLNTAGGLAMEEVLEATLEGMRQGTEATGIRAGLILCGIRNMDPATSVAIAKLGVACRERGVIAFDLAGAEAGNPVHRHAEAFEIAARGLLPATVHAGEAAGAESIRDALLAGRAARIGHGTRLHEDEALLAWVRDRSIPVEICLTSNVQTRVSETFESHPVRRFFDEGILLTLCTDNRLVSGTTVCQEYRAAARYLDFDAGELAAVARMGFESAFLPLDEKEVLLAEVDEELDDLLDGIAPD
jgi:adenosine deaminase